MRALPFALTPLLALGATSCDILDSATATTIVAGTMVQTPEVRLQGYFDVDAEVIATAWVAERESATSTSEPTPITGAAAAITFSGNRVPLVEQSTAGLYLTTSIDDPALVYASGSSYTVRATLPGEVGEILRREGLYSSHLTDWRKQRDLGKLDPDNPTKRGPKPKLSPHEKEILRLKKQLARQEEECKRWKAAVEIQGKLCELLGLPRADLSDDGTSC